MTLPPSMVMPWSPVVAPERTMACSTPSVESVEFGLDGAVVADGDQGDGVGAEAGTRVEVAGGADVEGG